MPPQTAITPVGPASWDDYVQREARRANVSPRLALAIMRQESSGRVDTPDSEAGAIGLMQLMPETAKALGVDPRDPVQNVRGGVRYLQEQLAASGGDVGQAVARYFGGPDPAQHGPKTQAYVQAVLGRLQPTKIATAPPTSVKILPLQRAEQWIQKPVGPVRVPAGEFDESSVVATPPPLWMRASRLAIPGVGAVVGGTKGAALGGMVGGPPGAFIGGVLGAATGGGIGEAAEVGVEKVAGRPVTMEGLKRRTAETAIASGVGEGVFRGAVTPILKKVAAPFASSVTPAGREAAETLTRTERGVSTLGLPIKSPAVTPAQVTENRALDIADNIVRKSIMGGGSHKALLARQSRLLDAETEQLILEYGARGVDPEVIGRALQQARVDQVAIRAAQASERYAVVAEKAAQAPVDIAPLETFIAQEPRAKPVLYGILDKVAPGWREAGGGEALSDGTPITGALRSALVQMGELSETETGTLTYPAAQRLRQELNIMGRAYARDTTGEKNIQVGIVKQLVKRLDDGITTGLKDTGGDPLVAAWRGANEFVKSYRTQLDDRFMRALGKANPSVLQQQIVKSAPERIRQVHNVIDTATWKSIQARTVENLVTTSEGRISGKSLVKQLYDLGPERLRALFPEGTADIQRLARELAQLETTRESIGGMYIQLAQAGAATTLLTGGFGLVGSAAPSPERVAGAGLILLGPAAIGKIMISPLGRKWLTTGLMQGTRVGSVLRISGEAATQLAALAQRTEPEKLERSEIDSRVATPPPR